MVEGLEGERERGVKILLFSPFMIFDAGGAASERETERGRERAGGGGDCMRERELVVCMIAQQVEDVVFDTSPQIKISISNVDTSIPCFTFCCLQKL